jgi:hypothetical protein
VDLPELFVMTVVAIGFFAIGHTTGRRRGACQQQRGQDKGRA